MKRSELCALVVLLPCLACAIRTEPKDVAPVTHEGIRYEAPHELMGYVKASDAESGKQLWCRRIYGIDFTTGLELDVQDVYITRLSVENIDLVILNEKGHEFRLNLGSLEVISPATGMVAFETSGDGRDVYAAIDMLEVTCTVVRFQNEELDPLIRQSGMQGEWLLKMWQNGQGELLAIPTLVTPSGNEAMVRSVNEIIYPTELEVPGPQSEDATVPGQMTPIPTGFETREVGSMLSVLPEVDRHGDIRVMLSLELVAPPEWRPVVSKFAAPGIDPIDVTLEQPIFHAYACTTSVILSDGETVLVSGGVPTRDEKGLIVTFLSVRKKQ